MAIQDDFTIDYVDRTIKFTTAFVDDRPPSIYTVNELYSYLQDTFDEPAQMDDPIPMSAQTPTQYTILYPWFIDDNTMKAIYGGSIQTSGWTKSGSEGITALRYTSFTSEPTDADDVGKAVTGTSTATGVILSVDEVRNVVWVRNTSATQFGVSDVIDDDATGIDPDFTLEAEAGFQTGESVWANLFSVGSLQSETEIYVGQEPDYLGGTAYHDADADSKFERRIEKIDEWWDSDVDFFTGSPNLLGGAGHFDILVKVDDAGTQVDGRRLAVFSRQFSKIYSSFELVGGVGNFVVPFASTGSDLNAQDGPYNIGFDTGSGGKAQLDVGDVIENDAATPVGRLRAVVTAVVGTTSGDFDYYLIGENEPLTTTDRTLVQFAENEDVKVRGDAFQFLIDNTGTPLNLIGPSLAGGVTITFADTQVDVDEDSVVEEYACTINCATQPLADVYKHVMFLTSRGNQDGTVTDTQDLLLPSGEATDEAGEFYRAVGDVVFLYNTGQGTQPTEGDLVTNGTGAYGVVTSITAGTTGTCVLTQVKGTFAGAEVVAEIDAAASNDITINGAVTSIVDNTGAPFGTFAGGRWFVAQGVVLTNVPAADANNWQTIDLTGVVKAPPTSRAITFAGLVANDRAFLAEVTTSGGIDITKTQNGVASGGALGASTFELDTTVALDVPAVDSWVRVVDDSATDGTEYRFYYTTVSGTTVTLDSGAQTSGTTDGAGTSTVLVDSGAFTNYGTANAEVRTGMEIRNTTDLSVAVVLRKIDNNSIETTVLTGGSDQTWASGDTWEANRAVVALDAADTCYFPFIDDEAITDTLTATIKYVGPTFLIARTRFSDPDVGGTRILPFEQKTITLTDADLTVTAIRTTDTIAS